MMHPNDILQTIKHLRGFGHHVTFVRSDLQIRLVVDGHDVTAVLDNDFRKPVHALAAIGAILREGGNDYKN